MSLNFNPYNGPWLQIYQQLFEVVRIDASNYNPIPNFLIPTQISNRIIVVGGSSQLAKKKWRYAGRLHPIIDCGNTDFQQAELPPLLVPLNKGQLYILPDYVSHFQLRFETFFWLEEIVLTIWEFGGVVT
jgi:hypothetical protein